MSTTRNILRNRWTRDTFTVNPDSSLTKLSKQSIFTRQVDYSPVDEFLQNFAARLPQALPKDHKEKILMRLRQEFAEKNKEVTDIIKNPQAFAKLISECGQQAAKTGFNPDAISLTGFLKSLGTSLLSAKLNIIFPGLALLAGAVVPAAAQAGFSYHAGQPAGGEDLCAKALSDCIQGYLTEVGQVWKSDLPQVARLVGQNTTAITDCIGQQDLENMMARAYRGPNDYSANCTVSAVTNNGGSLMVNATKVDGITCDIMKDSLIGYADQCPKPLPLPPPPPPAPTPTSHTSLYVGIGVASVAALAVLSFGIYRYLEHRRRHEECLLQEKSQHPNYQTV